MEILSPPLPPRTYELRNSPTKTAIYLALSVGVALFGFYQDGFWMKFGGGIFALLSVTFFLRLGDPRLLLASPEGIDIYMGLRRSWRIPWADVTDITSTIVNELHGTRLVIEVSETSPRPNNFRNVFGLSCRQVDTAADGYLLQTIGHDSAEVAEELKALYAEYVRDGVLKPSKLSNPPPKYGLW